MITLAWGKKDEKTKDDTDIYMELGCRLKKILIEKDALPNKRGNAVDNYCSFCVMLMC